MKELAALPVMSARRGCQFRANRRSCQPICQLAYAHHNSDITTKHLSSAHISYAKLIVDSSLNIHHQAACASKGTGNEQPYGGPCERNSLCAIEHPHSVSTRGPSRSLCDTRIHHKGAHVGLPAHSCELGSRQPLKWILKRVLVQGRGFYIGLSFWPGGTIEDWGPVLNETTQQLGLQPCLNATQYINSTNVTHQDYLVSAAF